MLRKEEEGGGGGESTQGGSRPSWVGVVLPCAAQHSSLPVFLVVEEMLSSATFTFCL